MVGNDELQCEHVCGFMSSAVAVLMSVVDDGMPGGGMAIVHSAALISVGSMLISVSLVSGQVNNLKVL